MTSVQFSLSPRQRFSTGFQAGLLAGLLATIIMVVLNLIAGGVSLAESLGSALALAMPLPVFNYLHQLIGADAKHYLLYVILAGQCLIFALSGGLCTLLAQPDFWTDNRGVLRWQTGLVLAAALWLFAGLIFLPLTGSGLFGANLSIGSFNSAISLAIVGIIFGLFFIGIQNWLLLNRLKKQSQQENQREVVNEANERRRSFIRTGLGVLGAGLFGTLAWRFISGGGGSSSTLSPSQVTDYQPKITPPTPDYSNFQAVSGLSPEISSNQSFYVVSKNLTSDPNVDRTTWTLTIDGLVAQPYTLTYKDITALPLKKQYETLMCISNEVGGSYMSNALWEGIPLTDLLQKAGQIKTGASKVVLHAADDYSDSIHLSKALEPTTMVALRMNGETLPTGHGFPARLLVPGIYGMKHVKWITRIEVVDSDYHGYWQQSGWSDPAPVRMTARIDTPHDGDHISAAKTNWLAGVAFSGNKGISAVEISFDEAKTWQRAILKQPPNDMTWVLWEYAWKPRPGKNFVTVRAIDKEGNVQNPTPASPLPDGSSGYQAITISAD